MLSHIYHLILIFQKPGKGGMAVNRIPVWQVNRGRKGSEILSNLPKVTQQIGQVLVRTQAC